MNAGTRVDHNQFCVTEQWNTVRDARGRAVGHHVTYELPLRDGRILRTRISRPVDKTTYGPALWKTILTDQLVVTEAEFWTCVRDKELPDRGQDDGGTPAKSLPAGLVYQLIHEAGVPESEVASMTLTDAMAVMTEHWSRPPAG
ncbi:hypothetical protein [Actinoplanes couchii]|uniref:Cytotoxic translational repressor of toxin-antitoxin stability system n=1 Tax=Actinoplanes couchii TaxID=403638 RepID=A0ABQ3XPD2_9ACTN|nr:hypothetical protein [Actinoplanes couchii]MDR6315834.1 hypothetical protein [Actinoplanes couchii]GID60370.1 hypothetical protein Aco03nite_087740 [Actinoplanes couchii]